LRKITQKRRIERLSSALLEELRLWRIEEHYI
jgi:hypothetical protein